jgi:hypothetical protein
LIACQTKRRYRKTMFPLIPKETHMLYKTICLQMIQDRPKLYDQFLSTRLLLTALDLYCNELKISHLSWKEQLARTRPGSSESQIASEALELAVKELEDRLPSASPPDDSEMVSLDAAMAFITRHTLPA